MESFLLKTFNHNQFDEISLLVRKDVKCLLRARGGIVQILVFALMLAVVGSFAFNRIGVEKTEKIYVMSGLIWLNLMFIASTMLNQMYLFEQEFSALEGLLRSRIRKSSIFISKFLSSLFFLWLVHIVSFVLLGLFLDESVLIAFFSLGFLSFLALVGIVSVGTLLAALSSLISAREIMLPIVLFPFSLPVVAAAVFLSNDLLQHGGLDTGNFWFVCLCVFDVIAFTAGCILFEYAVEE